MKKLIGLFILTVIISCQDTPTEVFTDSFDRKAMLVYWADHIIIPSFEAYDKSLDDLVVAKNIFIENEDIASFENLRVAYLSAYVSWQTVSMFDIGKAEEISLRNYTNIYPADENQIQSNIQGQNYDLDLPSNFDAQGFPALDYMLYGLAEDSNAEITLLKGKDFSNYLNELVDRLKSLNAEVLNDWKTNFRDSFINNDGSSATSSTDKLVNDFLFYYEKFLRAGKIGIPAGVFSGSALSNAVEAPYSEIYSKQLFFAGFETIQAFFKGVSFEGVQNGTSLEDYLIHVAEQNNTSSISDEILAQWALAEQKALALGDSFRNQVEVDNIKMLQTYDELQKAVILLKVDMLQALNIQVDFVDADGD
ncbi:MAG: imelysin family protein [Saprospiraceae bacterium]|nr:imelysin family protein [Saprospiraceae bacterium]